MSHESQHDEQWRPVVGYPGYEASDLGRVRSYWRKHGNKNGSKLHATPVPVAQRADHGGYMKVQLSKGGKSGPLFAHHLVLKAFVGPRPAGMEALHGSPDRADNRACNLRWGTRTENAADKVRHGTALFGERAVGAKLTAADVLAIRAMKGTGRTGAEVGKLYGVSSQAIYMIWLGRAWSHLLTGQEERAA